MNKYELIDSDIPGMFRIKALKSFSNIPIGDIGGYVSSKYNLSQSGNAWIYGGARVSGNARVSENAWISSFMVIMWRFKPTISINTTDGYTFTLNKDERKISAGCRYFTFPEAYEHWKELSRPINKERLQIVKMLEMYCNESI